tara:strand:- start:24128 stop:24721 length:594 start_codon:yes stop_codon:yes gene_type:complete
MADLIKAVNSAEDRVGNASFDYAYAAFNLAEAFKVEEGLNGFQTLKALAEEDRAHGGLGSSSYQTFARRERVGRALTSADVSKKAIKDSGAAFTSVARVAPIITSKNWKGWAEKARPDVLSFRDFEKKASAAIKKAGLGRDSSPKKSIQSELKAVITALKFESKIENVKRVPKKAAITFTVGDESYVVAVTKQDTDS